MDAIAVLLLSTTLLSADPVPRLSGGFVQLDDAAMNLTPQDWEKFLDKMTEIGLKTIIIQRLEFVGTDGNLSNFHRENGTDPTEEILKYADKIAGMRVFIGLRQDERWDDLRKNQGTLDALLDVNMALARVAWVRYKSHGSFQGWYLPQEMANYVYPADELKLLGSYFHPLSHHCRGLDENGKDVAISPYFNPASETWLTGAESYGINLKTILDGSEVTVVMLQDSVGARAIDPKDFASKLDPFYRETKKLATPTREFWANVESFKAGLIPTSFDRFEPQLRTAKVYADTIVTFDCYHYLNPLGFSHPPVHKKLEEKLYDDYKQAMKLP